MSKSSHSIDNYTETDFQVWVRTSQGAFWAYRVGLIHSVARNWAEAWNRNLPGDVPADSEFIPVKATTTFSTDLLA